MVLSMRIQLVSEVSLLRGDMPSLYMHMMAEGIS